MIGRHEPKRIEVHYEGLLPDLFREGRGVVTLRGLEFAPATSLSRDLVFGPIGDGKPRFIAREVLAKHDENYMPPEAAKATQGGTFRPGPEQTPVKRFVIPVALFAALGSLLGYAILRNAARRLTPAHHSFATSSASRCRRSCCRRSLTRNAKSARRNCAGTYTC